MSSDKKDPKSPATTSYAYDSMVPSWRRINTLLAGTDAMREAGQEYLPKHEAESDQNYNERLSRTTLFNMTELTLHSLVGKVFSTPVRLTDDVPERMKTLADDIDLQGNNITVVAREWFKTAVRGAFGFILVDMPALSEEERANRTREDDMREQRRPYWSVVAPENVIFASTEIVNGVERFTHVRILEVDVERDGFAEVIKNRIRVLEPGIWQVWEERKIDKSNKVEWVMVGSGTTSLDEVNIIPFYADRTGPLTGKPPLEDLSHLNIRHWQSTSDQINVLTVARFPMLAASGVSSTEGAGQRIGPRQFLGMKDPAGRYYYVEHTGKAIGAGHTDILDLEEKMASYGAEFLKRKTGNATATARALDSAETVSPLQDLAMRGEDALNSAWALTARWMGEENPGKLVVNTDFGPTDSQGEELERLADDRKRGDISYADYIHELQRRGVLSEDFDPKENLTRLLAERIVASPGHVGFRPVDTQGSGGEPEPVAEETTDE